MSSEPDWDQHVSQTLKAVSGFIDKQGSSVGHLLILYQTKSITFGLKQR